ncbi:MAG TPA: ATP-binding protein, partial [Pseudorhodoferax sp.]|nr:ATP-binding protein [Pseudorhodoferax sp.]
EQQAHRDAPEQASLKAMERALREAYSDEHEVGETSDSPILPRLLVWQAGHLIYHADDVPAELRNSRLNTVETLLAQDKRWRASTRQSEHSDTRVMLAMPADAKQLLMTFNSHGYYLMPLVICTPLLLLPAWLSIRLVLRPWREVGREIAARGPQDLTPLAFVPRHQELRPLVDSVNGLMHRLCDSAARERNFIADAAHELRTPIAAMRVNVEALLAQPELTARQSELLQGVSRSNDRATRLVGQLLRLMRSSADAHAVVHETLALDALLQDRLAALSGLAEASGVELALEVAGSALCVTGEREGLTSMVDNLVENATKYSPRAGMVMVQLARSGSHAVLSVEDRGPGIAPILRARVFDRFFRDPDQTQTGSGLGLAIVRSVVERHGGRIALDSTMADGRGLRVTVWLPLAGVAGGDAADGAAGGCARRA